LACREKFQASEIDNWTVGCVFARDPLRIIKSERARRRWDYELSVEDFARGFGRINEDLYRWRIRLCVRDANEH
jgi:hypothetical protein